MSGQGTRGGFGYWSGMTTETLSRPARILGYAGLLPQAISLVLLLQGGEWGFIALAGGFAYAALIFSFLGGVWWGQALLARRGDVIVYLIAVLPSLLALALFLPWTFGWQWPEPQLLCLGVLIALSPCIDRWLGLSDPAFMQLRWHLSLGLGTLTAALGLIGIEPV
ncbi:DUF3429 domain-containing protein [Altererythrobacter sp.]|uniref:DUF3429 domain-containing protein n=1 Tax=Altererythrobacter sp. TaxID=1872480 RepID=UPI00257BC7DB|nr:DUF3429 domain-containing protein [Altererythrobacter sp.]